MVASNGDDWSGGDGLWRSNERFNEKRDLGKRKKKMKKEKRQKAEQA